MRDSVMCKFAPDHCMPKQVPVCYQMRILTGTCQQGGNLTNFPILNSQLSFEGAGVQPFPISRIHSNSRSLG